MPQRNEPTPGEGTEMVEDDEEVVECKQGDHLSDLDELTRRALSMFSTIRGKVGDLERAESDIKRFELSIESERKRLQKNLESAKGALRNARVQMGVELAKVDQAGFEQVAKILKEANNA